MHRLRSVGVASIVLASGAALIAQACEDDPTSSGFTFDTSAPEINLPDTRRDDAPAPVPDASEDASEDAAEDAALDADAGDAALIEAGLNDGSAPLQPVRLFDRPYALAIDTQYLYVAVRQSGLFRVAKDGSSAVRMTIDEGVARMALDGNRIFFTTVATDAGDGGEVKVIPTNAVDGGGETLVIGDLDGGVLPVRYDGTSTLLLGMYNNSFGTEVLAVETDGGNLRSIATGLRPYDIAVTGGHLYAAAAGTANQQIRQVPLDGGAFTSRATATGTVSDFVAKDGYVYWSTRGGTVMRIPVGDAGAAETIATGQGPVAGIAVDDVSIYWAVYKFDGTGAVRRAPKGGGEAPVTLAANLNDVFSVAVDSTHVYWGAYTADGGVGRTLK